MYEKTIQRTVGPQGSYLPPAGLDFTPEKHVNETGHGLSMHKAWAKSQHEKEKKGVIAVRVTRVY